MSTMKRMPLGLQGTTVSRLSVDFRVGLEFEDQGTVELSCPFRLSLPQLFDAVIDPEGQKTELAPLLKLIGSRVSDSRVDADALTIVFEDGSIIQSGPDPDFESWEFSSSAGNEIPKRIICLPEGGLAIWGDFPNEETSQ